MPFDGDHRAAYALLHDDGTIEHHRVGYDHVRVPVALRARFGDADWVAVPEKRFETAPPRGVLTRRRPGPRDRARARAAAWLRRAERLVALDAEPPAVVECARLRPRRRARARRGARAAPRRGRATSRCPSCRSCAGCRRSTSTRRPARSPACSAGSRCSAAPCATSPALLPGETVVAAQFETTDPAVPLGLAGRPGDPVAVLLGEHEFELDRLSGAARRPAARPDRRRRAPASPEPADEDQRGDDPEHREARRRRGTRR